MSLFKDKWEDFKTKDTNTNWGNPFREEYLTGTDTILISTKPINLLKTTYEDSNTNYKQETLHSLHTHY